MSHKNAFSPPSTLFFLRPSTPQIPILPPSNAFEYPRPPHLNIGPSAILASTLRGYRQVTISVRKETPDPSSTSSVNNGL